VSSTFSNLELRVMEVLWAHGALAVRQVQEKLSDESSPAYTTIQTIVYRLEAKGALRRARKIGNAHIFEAVVPRETVDRRG
jgi:BlaI family penicillinase repressor